jgi:16S rRNA (adenine1518-N6/adenine1519-N6)-dimethyltransferase
VRVAAIELDPRLAAALAQRFDPAQVGVLHGDVREHALEQVAAALGPAPSPPLIVVSNLPYSVSKPVAQKVVAERASIARAVLMFQREVADRVRAAPGSRDYGPLSVLCGLAFTIDRLFDVAPHAFRPRPQVASTVTRWTRRTGEGTLDPELEPALRRALTACFAHRRQTLRNNLRAALGSDARAASLLDAAGLDPALRAEQLDPAAFVRLARALGDLHLV